MVDAPSYQYCNIVYFYNPIQLITLINKIKVYLMVNISNHFFIQKGMSQISIKITLVYQINALCVLIIFRKKSCPVFFFFKLEKIFLGWKTSRSMRMTLFKCWKPNLITGIISLLCQKNILSQRYIAHFEPYRKKKRSWAHSDILRCSRTLRSPGMWLYS